MSIGAHPIENLLLAALSGDDKAKLDPFLHHVDLPKRSVVSEAGAAIHKLHFFEGGLASIVTPGASIVEVGLIGREGFAGWPLLQGLLSHPYRTFMQVAGHAFTLDENDVDAAQERIPHLRRLLQQSIGLQMIQLAQASACASTHSVNQRLSRWLLMSQDRLRSDVVPLTQEFLSFMLAIRRPSVTIALQALEVQGAIRQEHGRILIVDRPTLKARSCSCYDIVSAEYDRHANYGHGLRGLDLRNAA